MKTLLVILFGVTLTQASFAQTVDIENQDQAISCYIEVAQKVFYFKRTINYCPQVVEANVYDFVASVLDQSVDEFATTSSQLKSFSGQLSQFVMAKDSPIITALKKEMSCDYSSTSYLTKRFQKFLAHGFIRLEKCQNILKINE